MIKTSFRTETPIVNRFTLSFLVMGLISCANHNTSTREQLTTPNYVTLGGAIFDNDIVNISDWSVACDGRNHVIVNRNETQLFYKEDGELKTKKEFCDEYGPRSILKRKK